MQQQQQHEAEIDVFLEFPYFLLDPMNVGNLISGSSESLIINQKLVQVLLKPIMKDFEHNLSSMGAFQVLLVVKNPPAKQEIWVRFLGWKDTLEKEMATRSSILTWKIPWTEEPGGLQPTGLQRVRHNCAHTCSSLLECEMSVTVQESEHYLVLPFGIGMKTTLFQSCGHC